MASCASSPWGFGFAVLLTYTLLILPIFVRAHFDPSVFVVAGDKFADAPALAVPIRIQPHSTGFDGQFYYRMALAPFRLSRTAFGITIDDPAIRLQRILYPVLAWLLAFGQKPFIAAAMVLVNLLGMAILAATAVRLTRRLKLPSLTPLAIVLWPGFIITATHDTTEILSAAFVLLTLEAFLAGNLLTLLLAGMAATLTRETGVVVLAGLLCLALWNLARPTFEFRAWPRFAVAACAFLPLLVWQAVLQRAFNQLALASDTSVNLGWPFQGAIQALWETLTGTRFYVRNHVWQVLMRGFVLCSAPLLLSLCALMAWRLPAALHDAAHRAVAAAWLPLALLMMLLTGPWIDPVSYFRAFTECFVVGALLLAWRPMRPWLSQAFTGAGVLTFAFTWGLCFMSLR
jgi:hypothetical protein